MPNSFVVDEATKESFAGRTLLLDTNALIDAFRLPAEFYDLATEFARLNCDLVTTKSIVLEFLGGTTDQTNIEKKKQFLEVTFGRTIDKTYLPLDHSAPNLQDLLQFSRSANKFSVADYELYCTIKKYQKRIALVSRNHKDFSTKLARRISFITLLGTSEIHTYGIYSIE